MSMRDCFERSPVITAVKNDKGLEKALNAECEIIFVLYGDICNIKYIVRKIKECGKIAIVHVDLINGLGSREIVVDFIKENTEADGIISTKIMLVRRAKELGLYGGLRAFVIDSMALENTKKQLDVFRPDFIEIMPGVVTKSLKILREYTTVPIIAGGLLSDKKEVMAAFESGVDAISTTREELWSI